MTTNIKSLPEKSLKIIQDIINSSPAAQKVFTDIQLVNIDKNVDKLDRVSDDPPIQTPNNVPGKPVENNTEKNILEEKKKIDEKKK